MVDAGSISGIVVFAVTLIITVTFIICGTLHTRKREQKEAEEAAEENKDKAGTSLEANGDAKDRKNSMAGLKPVKANHRRHSVVHMLE